MIRLILVSGMMILAWSGTASAQSPAPAQSDSSLVKQLPAIPASEVPRRAEEARVRLERLRQEIEHPATIRAIESDMERVVAAVELLEEDPRALEPRRASKTALVDLRQECLRRQTRLSDWSRSLERRAAALMSIRQQLDENSQLWMRTREDLLGDTLTSRQLSDVDAVLELEASVAKELRAQLGSTLAMQGDVSDLWRRLTVILDRIGVVGGPGLTRIAPERPPLWREIGAATWQWRLGDIWSGLTRSTYETVREDPQRFVGQTLLFIAFAALTLVVRGRKRHWSQEDSQALQPFMPIFTRPLAAALMGTLVFTSAFYQHPPALLLFAARALMALLALRLLPGLTPSKLIGPIWALVLLYILDLLEILLYESATLQRVHLLLVDVLALLGCLWVLRSRVLESIQRPRLGRFLTQILGFFVVVLVLAGLANVVGAVQFADSLVDLPLKGLYYSMIALIGIRVLEGIARVFLRLLAQLNLRFVSSHLELLDRRSSLVVWALVAFLWAQTMLRTLGVSDPQGMFRRLVEPRFSLGSLELGLGDILAFGITLWVATLFSRLLRFILGEDVLPRLRLARGIPETILQLLHYAVLTVGFLLAVAATGFDLTRLTILAGALGVGVGFGMQNVVNNFVSGLILMFERPIQVGDTVEIGPLIGRVGRIGIRSSTVRTFAGADVVVPNGNLIANEVVNWTLSDYRRRIDIRVGVAYGSDIAQVQEVLLGVARAHPSTLPAPEPVALFLAFGDSSLDFELRFWTGNFETWVQASSEVGIGIVTAFRAAGIEIPFPQRDLHVRDHVMAGHDEGQPAAPTTAPDRRDPGPPPAAPGPAPGS